MTSHREDSVSLKGASDPAAASALHRLPFAVNEHNQLVGIREVERGLRCNCHCPGCGAKLVAKQGDRNAWHFAHYEADACLAGYESALHLAIKSIVETDRALLVPSCGVIKLPYSDRIVQRDHNNAVNLHGWAYVPESAETVASSCYDSMVAYGFADIPGKLVQFDSVTVEQNEGDIRPDLIGVVGGRRLYIEVAVTHFVDSDKLSKIRRKGAPTVEIVIAPDKDLDLGRLRRLVLENSGCTRWLYNPKAEQQAEACYKARLPIIEEERLRKAEEQARFDEEFEQRRKAVERKKRNYERYFKPTHELIFAGLQTSQRTKIYLRMCPSYISLHVFPYEHELATLVTALAHDVGGDFNKSSKRWEFVTGGDMLLALARSLLASRRTTLRQAKAANPSELQGLIDQLSSLHL
ncbi:hypothetical protein JI739_24155 [Ramlibacter sp. AW1]|uniref:Competence protein CoiA-like N-terminal domain-containing protein n=1 Tax=Ramlibacter aurantiacus TaxID=2801330 RepID=A0A936ZNJ0_9BURK|nr:competence protein CoiA family protein [Ramlibacter aurantiacus]MBL0423448.1 hypothetical protein [Ramlibacter aurantiacus]